MRESSVWIICLLFGVAGFSCIEKSNPRQLDKAQTIGEDTTYRDKQCMTRVISTDDSLGLIRNFQSEKTSLSVSIGQYVAEISTLDLSECPEEFRKAFTDHVLAWQEILAVTDRYGSLRGEMHDLFEMIETGKDSVVFGDKQRRIWETWAEVESAMD